MRKLNPKLFIFFITFGLNCQQTKQKLLPKSSGLPQNKLPIH
jgi:hypothetical protein